MARLPKRQLFRIVEKAIQECGWSYLYLGSRSEHPARYHVYSETKAHQVRVYIWNVTHGGGAARAANEYRIQITGIPGPTGAQQFIPEVGDKTLILGWWEDVGVFAGFDYAHHSGPLGASPSMQINEESLRAAHLNGFAPYNKGNGELAIAFRPDFIGTYIDFLEELHACGTSNDAIRILDDLGQNPDEVDLVEIKRRVPRTRRYAIVSTKRALRDLDFSDRVLTAYGHRCAMCAIQLNLLDAAHILPVAVPESTDETCNGISLCTLHHRAYDRGLVTFDGDFATHLKTSVIAELNQIGRDGGIDEFSEKLRPVIILPPDRRDRPGREFVEASNNMRGWEF